MKRERLKKAQALIQLSTIVQLLAHKTTHFGLGELPGLEHAGGGLGGGHGQLKRQASASKVISNTGVVSASPMRM